MSFFSKESEETQRKYAPAGFWQDQETRRVVISDEFRPSKKNPDKQVRWLIIKDIDANELRENPDFTLQSALSDLPDGVSYNNMILKVTPTLESTDAQGYDRFTFSVEATGEYVATSVGPADSDVGF